MGEKEETKTMPLSEAAIEKIKALYSVTGSPEAKLAQLVAKQQELDAIPADEKTLEDQIVSKQAMKLIGDLYSGFNRRQRRAIVNPKMKFSAQMRSILK